MTVIERVAAAIVIAEQRGLDRYETARAAMEAAEQKPIGWIYEDELPDGYPYDLMFPYSKVECVRLFPVFAPIDAALKDEA